MLLWKRSRRKWKSNSGGLYFSFMVYKLLFAAMVVCCFSCGMHGYTSKFRFRPAEPTTSPLQEKEKKQALSPASDTVAGQFMAEESLSNIPPKTSKLAQAFVAEKMHPEQQTSVKIAAKKPVTEKRIRAKGFGSIGIGLTASTALGGGLVLFFGGVPLGLLLIFAGAVLAFLGMKLALSAQRDADSLTARSTMDWLRRPARIGGTINVIVLLVSGLIAFLTLISLAF